MKRQNLFDLNDLLCLIKPTWYRFLFLSLCIFLIWSSVSAQTYSSSNPGGFGIDGDIYSDYVMKGNFTPAGSHDWFLKPGGSGLSVFDTSNAAYYKQQLSQDVNFSFMKRMQYPAYSMQGGQLYLDACYTRDYLGTTLYGDKTVFKPSMSSTMDPTTWATQPGGGNVTNTSDILDGYIHVRRLTNSNNHLMAYLGASTLATNGVRYFDFEFFKSMLSYDSATGTFSNSGPSATGGHSIWTFNADGSINTFGDMVLSFSFNTTSVTSIDIWIWIPYTTYNAFVPAGFDFSTGSGMWAGKSPNGGYGYAHIQPKAGTAFAAWGMVSSDTTLANSAPPWGTNSKDLGSVNTASYYTTKYYIGQFGEAAIDLTNMGIDFSANATVSPCANPYTRILIKSRATSAFSSSLQDFVGPIQFFAPPQASASALGSNLTCLQTTSLLQPQTVYAGVNYTWSTTNGAITGRSDSTYAVASKPGTYFLNANSPACNINVTDSVTVLQDLNKPVATAGYTGVLSTLPGSYITLKGGDTIASNYMTPFGGSQGLLWNWTGPNGFASALENPTATSSGTYQLTVTEKRNGCTATATTTVLVPMPPMAMHQIDLQGNVDVVNHTIQLKWKVEQLLDSKIFEVQRSLDGRTFVTICKVVGVNNSDLYTLSDRQTNDGNLFYRIMIEDSVGKLYSNTLSVKLLSGIEQRITRMQNPVTSTIEFGYSALNNGSVQINVYSAGGIRMPTSVQQVQKGYNTISLPANALVPGLYFLEVINNEERAIARFLKQ